MTVTLYDVWVFILVGLLIHWMMIWLTFCEIIMIFLWHKPNNYILNTHEFILHEYELVNVGLICIIHLALLSFVNNHDFPNKFPMRIITIFLLSFIQEMLLMRRSRSWAIFLMLSIIFIVGRIHGIRHKLSFHVFPMFFLAYHESLHTPKHMMFMKYVKIFPSLWYLWRQMLLILLPSHTDENKTSHHILLMSIKVLLVIVALIIRNLLTSKLYYGKTYGNSKISLLNFNFFLKAPYCEPTSIVICFFRYQKYTS
jgi:hypothetical protein